jgi:gas vesicle protein
MDAQDKVGHGTGTVVLAALGGAAVGAAVALLLAPRSGRETRRQIAGYVDTAKDTLARVPEALKQASHAAREALDEGPAEAAHPAARHASRN